MYEGKVIVLDFDGVICDSVYELIESCIRSASVQFPSKFPSTLNPNQHDQLTKLLLQFRPKIKTGYELILIAYALSILNDYSSENDEVLNDLKLKLPSQEELLKKWPQQRDFLLDLFEVSFESVHSTFNQVRENWILTSEQEWLSKNPLYSGIPESIIESVKAFGNKVYVATTKEKKFCLKLLRANGIHEEIVPDECVYGLKDQSDGKKISKVDVIKSIKSQYPNSELCFIEDFIQTLEETSIVMLGAGKISLYLVDYGYNTEADRNKAKIHPFIELINKEEFVKILKSK